MSKKKLDLFNDIFEYDFTDKRQSVKDLMLDMFIRTQSMFEYTGLPESIPQKYLEFYIQSAGHCCITSVNGRLYALQGAFGGVPDPYYVPEDYVVSNPSLKFSKTLKIDDDCIVIGNDPFYRGIMDVNRRYATALAENNISFRLADINTRIISLISASDDRTKSNAVKFLKDIEEGKLGIISSNEFLEGIKAQAYNSTSNNALVNLIEYHQYLKASWYNELGLQSNYNMKRESITSSEGQMNEDILTPLIDIMLKTRQEALEKVNDMFGTDISVKLSSAWQENKEEHQAQLDILESEADDEQVLGSDGVRTEVDDKSSPNSDTEKEEPEEIDQEEDDEKTE